MILPVELDKSTVRQEIKRLGRFDLNLLLLFETMMEERSVSRSAERLALSQPATSQGLTRLRALLGDRLFVRTAGGMEPTVRALQLATPIRRALESLEQALEPEDFSPATTHRTFRLAVNNHAALVLAAPILMACAADAPAIYLDIRPSGTLPIRDLLDRGELDFVITAQPLDRERYASKILIEDDYRIVMRTGHPQAGAVLSLDAFVALSRVEVSSSGDDMSFVAQALMNAGMNSRTAGAVPYLSLRSLLCASDHIAVVRGHVAKTLARSGGILQRTLPLPGPRVASVLSWHQRHTGHAAYGWFVALVDRISQSLIDAEAAILPDGTAIRKDDL